MEMLEKFWERLYDMQSRYNTYQERRTMMSQAYGAACFFQMEHPEYDDQIVERWGEYWKPLFDARMTEVWER